MTENTLKSVEKQSNCNGFVNCEERNGSMRRWSPGIRAHSYPDEVHQIGLKEAKQTVTKK